MASVSFTDALAILAWGGLVIAMAAMAWHLARRHAPRRLDRVVSGEIGYAAVIDSLSDGVLVYGEDGRIKACNPAAGAILGREQHELVGAGIAVPGWKVEDESGAEITEDQHPVLQAIRTGKPHVRAILKVKSPEGRSRWIRSSVTALSPGQKTGPFAVVAKFRDVTEQHRAGLALKEAEQTFRHLFDHSPNAVSITRAADALILDVNGAWCQLFHWTREEAIGRTLFDLGIWTRPEDRMALLPTVQHGRALDAGPFETSRKDGARLHTSLWLAPVRLNGQECLMAVLQDHTHARDADIEKHKVEKAGSLGLMAAGIAHDFNNLFQALLANLELAHVQSDASSRRLLDRAMSSLEKATTLTQRLMEFSGGSFTHRQPLCMVALIRDAVEQHQFGEHIHLQLRLGTDLPEVTADREQLHRVLCILIENAAEAMGPRGGTMTVASDQMPGLPARERETGLWVVEPPEGPVVRLSVSDTGGGVERDVLNHLFEPFFSTKALGRGLGLPAALGLIRGNRAGLQVLNRPGEGLTFHVYLPAERQPE